MAKEEPEFMAQGKVLHALSDTQFRVRLDVGHELIAYTDRKTALVPGETVTVAIKPFKFEKGRIVLRGPLTQ
ncbi:MAG: translation initiation factor IF-1 [Gemmataceae bacterium]|nr:translation initiation factor IF-1 [Gemmataceae bacterium]